MDMTQKYIVDANGLLLGTHSGPIETNPYGSQIYTTVMPQDALVQRWNGSAWIDDRADLLSRREGETQTLLDQKIDAGIEYPIGSGKILQIREKDRMNIDTVGQEARWSQLAGGAGWDPNFAWRMQDDSYLPLPTPQDMIDLGMYAKQKYYALLKARWTHVDAMRALPTVAQIAAYDITVNWG